MISTSRCCGTGADRNYADLVAGDERDGSFHGRAHLEDCLIACCEPQIEQGRAEPVGDLVELGAADLRSSLMKMGRSGDFVAVARSASPTVKSIHAPARKYSAASAGSQYVTPSIRFRTPAIGTSREASHGRDTHDVAIQRLDLASQATGEQCVPDRGLELQLLATKLENLFGT